MTELKPGAASLVSSRMLTVPRLARRVPVPLRLRRPSPVLQGIAALVAYLAVWTIGWGSPLLLHAQLPQLNQRSMDPNFYTWSLRWWPYAISHGLNPLFSRQIGAPTGFNLGWTTTVPALALAAAPLTAAVGAVASYNVLIVIAPPLAAWATFVAFRRMTRRFWPALAGGAVFGFAAYETHHSAAGQLNLTWSLLLPLMVYLVVLWRDEKLSRTWFVFLLALAMLAQLFIFLETFAEVTVVWILGLLIGYALAGASARPIVAKLARHVAAALVAAVAVASPYFLYMLTHYPKGFSRSPAVGGLDLANLVVPAPHRSFGLAALTNYSSHLPYASFSGYVGIPMLLIVLGVAVFNWSSKIARFLVLMVVIIVALAAGPELFVGTVDVGPTPWSRLWFLPIARSALPGRFMLIASLALGGIMAVWLAAPVRSRWLRFSRWLLAVLAIGTILADAPPSVAAPAPGNPGMAAPALVNPAMPTFISTGQYQRYLHRGEIVMVISTRGNAAMLFQAETDFYMRVAGGYINMAITPRSDLPGPVIRLSHATSAIEAQFRVYVKAAGIKAILVERRWEPLWVGVLNKMGFHGHVLGGVVYYRV